MTRWLGGDTGTPAHRRGGEVRDFVFEALSGMRQELRSLLAATAADEPAQLAAFEGAVRSAAAIGARGERREASLLLGQHAGRLTWLATRHPGARAEQLRGQAALMLGTFALACGRDAAAAHGFTQGIAAYRTLVGGHGRRDCVDRYLRAMCAQVMLNGARGGEAAGVRAAVRTLEDQARRYDPRNVTRWVEHARASLAGIAPPGAVTGPGEP
ncbi:hypothetical protein E0500_038860 [Streptomyces sp. KM273126]|uniref:hypothetical protein n=1 Tax=Streptomyces sp. KM273126 TaxID=2545247 RepID=UPI00103A5CE5|nr:hypothetical protein [Streptomyces sp. KM273126]MBA2813118.1 hypothetical protein [Streptomyces sp. KM273126]